MHSGSCIRLQLLSLTFFLASCGGAPAETAATTRTPSANAAVAHPELYDEVLASYSSARPHSFAFHPQDPVLYYLKQDDSGLQALFVYNLTTHEEKKFIDVQSLLGNSDIKLSDEEKARRERLRQRATGITQYSLSDDGKIIMVPLSGQIFLIMKDNAPKELRIEGHAIDARLSPDATTVAYVKDRDLYVYDLRKDRERRVVRAGQPEVRCGVAEFVAQEEMHRYQGFWWSPDSSKLAYQCNDESGVQALYVQDPARPEQPAAELRYPRAGTRNVSVRLFVHDLKRRRSSEFSLGESAEYLVDLRWSADSRPLPIVQDRAQQQMWMIGCGASNDPLSICPMERVTHKAWINIDHKLPLREDKTWLWSLDTPAGPTVRMRHEGSQGVHELLSGNAGYREALGIAQGHFYFVGGPEPSESHVYRVALEPGSTVEQLSEKPGVHRGWLAKSGHWIDRASLADGSQSLTLYEGKKPIAELPSKTVEAPFVPRLEVTSVGERQYRAAIIRPRDFDKSLRYPVIVSVYGGPSVTVVHNAPNFYLMDQWLADEGFIVVKIDGRGTPNRDDAWEKATYKDVITIPLNDQVEALRALGARYPELDLERVGIQGWSFGGYFSAMAAMQRPDVFKAAIAGAPVTDWRDYDTHYTERYMGLPAQNQGGYERTSVLAHAAKLERPLLIVHGMADDNVLYTHSAKLADALTREGKEFELIPLVQATHMGGSGNIHRALQFRYVRFFKRHLGTPAPAR